MPVPATIIGSITALFDANKDTIFAGVADGTGLWVEEIPEDKSRPFVCLMHYGEIPEFSYDDMYLELLTCAFEAYAVNLGAAEALALKVKSVFDLKPPDARTKLVFTEGETLSCQRKAYTISKKDKDGNMLRDANGNLVYRVEMMYQIQTQLAR